MVRSFGRLGSASLAPDSLHPDTALPPRSSARSGPTSFAMMRGRPGSSSLVPDLAHLDLTLPARSFGSSDLPPLLRSLACMDSAFLLCGLSRFASSLLALDWAHLGLVALLQSFTWTGASVLVPDSLQSGVSHAPPEPCSFGICFLGMRGNQNRLDNVSPGPWPFGLFGVLAIACQTWSCCAGPGPFASRV